MWTTMATWAFARPGRHNRHVGLACLGAVECDGRRTESALTGLAAMPGQKSATLGHVKGIQ